jgi:hypothetical protein
MKINFGLIAIDRQGNILHFCGYENPPTSIDKKLLEKELATDPEFGLIGKQDQYAVTNAPEALVEIMRKDFEASPTDQDQ